MPFRVAIGFASTRRRTLFWVSLALLWRPAIGRADEPQAETPAVAKPAGELAGTLAHTRKESMRKNKKDLMNLIDTAIDVVYTTDESPIPEDQQFQFVQRALRTPEKGGARLCVPVEAPKFYRLTVVLESRAAGDDPRVGVGGVLDGRQFFIESGRRALTLGRFFDQQVVGKFPNRPNSGPPSARPKVDTLRLLVGDCGFVYSYRGWSIEWAGASRLLSLDPKWAVPAKDKLFLTFSDGQFDIHAIEVMPLTREQWLKYVEAAKPDGRVARFNTATAQPKISSTVEPLPGLDSLESTAARLCHEGDFDELERWADRFRRGQVVASYRFASETFYDWLGRSYLPIATTDESVVRDAYWQQQLAFTDAWIKQKPDSVAARVVKAKTYIKYAWEARGDGLADSVTAEGWRLFHERLAKAEELLAEAADKPTADSCVFAQMLTIGMAEGWEPEEMERTLERGLQISTKNFNLYDNMAFSLLPRWHGAPGDVEKFAQRMVERVKGDDGLEIYFRAALSMLLWREQINESWIDRLRSAVPVMLQRYPDSSQFKSFACWSYCLMKDSEAAKPLFAEIAALPDESVWGSSRTVFDRFHHWCDPSIPEPSQFLEVEGEEAANLQAYSGDLVSVQFLSDSQTLVTSNPQFRSPIKLWNCQERKITQEFTLARTDWRILHFRRLTDDSLFAVVQDRAGMTGAYSPPNHAFTRWHFEIRGLEVIRVSDDLQTGVSIKDEVVTVVHVRKNERPNFQVAKLTDASLSRDGKHLLTSGEKLQLWDSTTGEELAALDVASKYATFLEDHSGFIYVTSDKLAVWDIEKKQERFSASFAAPSEVRLVTSTKDGWYIATAELRVDADGTKHEVVVLWDLEKPDPVHIFAGHKQPIQRLAFSPDAHWLASGSPDGIVKVWDVEKALVAAVEGTPAAGASDKPAEGAAESPAKDPSTAPAN